MSDLRQYTLHWRGKESGPFSVGEIKRKIARREITLSHEILYDNKWIPLHDFFDLQEAEEHALETLNDEAAAKSDQTNYGFAKNLHTWRRPVAVGLLIIILLCVIWYFWPIKHNVDPPEAPSVTDPAVNLKAEKETTQNAPQQTPKTGKIQPEVTLKSPISKIEKLYSNEPWAGMAKKGNANTAQGLPVSENLLSNELPKKNPGATDSNKESQNTLPDVAANETSDDPKKAAAKSPEPQEQPDLDHPKDGLGKKSINQEAHSDSQSDPISALPITSEPPLGAAATATNSFPNQPSGNLENSQNNSSGSNLKPDSAAASTAPTTGTGKSDKSPLVNQASSATDSKDQPDSDRPQGSADKKSRGENKPATKASNRESKPDSGANSPASNNNAVPENNSTPATANSSAGKSKSPENSPKNSSGSNSQKDSATDSSAPAPGAANSDKSSSGKQTSAASNSQPNSDNSQDSADKKSRGANKPATNDSKPGSDTASAQNSPDSNNDSTSDPLDEQANHFVDKTSKNSNKVLSAPFNLDSTVANSKPPDTSATGASNSEIQKTAPVETVFLVDQSYSMRGRNSVLALEQLSDHLKSLSTNDSFYILFFHSSGYDAMPSQKPLKATPENIQTMLQWSSKVRHVFGSNPVKATGRALDFHPGAICFISDGKFSKNAIDAITESNKTVRAQINAVNILSPKGEKVLRGISEKNNGIYRSLQSP